MKNKNSGDNKYKPFVRKGITYAKPWSPDMDMAGVSISEKDAQDGSPKLGDMIARNPDDHSDRWLIAEKWFEEHFEPFTDK